MSDAIDVDDPTGLWAEVIGLSRACNFLLVGGQMVRTFAMEADIPMPRTTDDIDALLRATTSPAQPEVFAELLVGQGYEPLPMAEDLGYRFHHPTRGWSVDVLIPDKPHPRRPVRTVGSLTPASIPGGGFALRHAEQLLVRTPSVAGEITRPALLGALLLKSRAARTDRGPGAARHREDLAVLYAAARAPRALTPTPKERSELRRATPALAALPATHRQTASDAYRLLTAD